jgi:hypothetical protein
VSHNLAVRRFLAACLLTMFAALATADTFACPDGCESANTPSAADHCNVTGSCVFCSGGVVALAIPAPSVDLLLAVADPSDRVLRPAFRPASALDHPPRPS